jgi:hypothetical protein
MSNTKSYQQGDFRTVEKFNSNTDDVPAALDRLSSVSGRFQGVNGPLCASASACVPIVSEPSTCMLYR